MNPHSEPNAAGSDGAGRTERPALGPTALPDEPTGPWARASVSPRLPSSHATRASATNTTEPPMHSLMADDRPSSRRFHQQIRGDHGHRSAGEAGNLGHTAFQI